MAYVSSIKIGNDVRDIKDSEAREDILTKQKKIYYQEPENPEDGDLWIDDNDPSVPVQIIDAGNVIFEQGTEYPDNSVGSEINKQSATIADKADKSKIKSITLSSIWTGSASPYMHSVSISGYTVTANTKVDLQPDATTIQQLIDDGVFGLYVLNNNGTLTAYAIGEKPTVSLTIQVTVSEVTI